MARFLGIFLSFSVFLIIISGCSRFKKDSSSPENTREPQKAEDQTLQFRDEREAAIYKARKLFESQKKEKMDFSTGPCLSEEIIKGWAVDIAHFPRKIIDEKAENQCPSYLKKQVKHFVELDPDGNIIRAL